MAERAPGASTKYELLPDLQQRGFHLALVLAPTEIAVATSRA